MNLLVALQTLAAWLAGDGGLTIAAVVGFGVLLLAWAALRRMPVASEAERRVPPSRRERAGRGLFVRQRDPDAAGRSRPRAPSAGPAPA
ncbi:hypothetical protein FHS43_000034 [Streptosporangium becharense]|uniref:Uncharacterized protein n=1 Tax=Streptosporangium becharense TaxID=1816182 RepID=A0A7W9IHK6_9ACTN|nr:DUF6412 domain-containing protein [Streptosporangium becharense]MBB2908788.1 hypothetical protein [Streptosporangium becharense]MBB5820194.1 hypothetical protein [Streptosporangium becharense]